MKHSGKHFWKRSMLLAFMLVFLFMSICCPLKARASFYSIPNVNFTITINEDGSADVVELWTVSFEDGSFTRFYKDIVTNAGPEDTVRLDTESVYVRIDGVDCNPTNDTEGRPNNTYHLGGSDAGYEIDCYKASKDVTRTYEIGYRIENAVKLVGDEYYLFTYRLIGANFSQMVAHISVTV